MFSTLVPEKMIMKKKKVSSAWHPIMIILFVLSLVIGIRVMNLSKELSLLLASEKSMVSDEQSIATGTSTFSLLPEDNKVSYEQPKENIASLHIATPSVSATLGPSPLQQYNSSEYTWVGNHFIPPKNVPTFTPKDYLNYFQNRNTLFIGDSTGRRAYASLYAMMKYTAYRKGPKNKSIDIPLLALDDKEVIDFNKEGFQPEYCNIEERTLFNSSAAYQYVCRDILVENKDTRTNISMENKAAMVVSNSTGKFDYFAAPCLSSLSLFFNKEEARTLFKDYDLIVIANGVWEATRSYYCIMNDTATNTKPLTQDEKYDLVFGSIVNASSPSLQIVFRTPGFDKHGHEDGIVWGLINHIKQYSSSTTSSSNHPPKNAKNAENNITVVDWGTVISRRSNGPRRIDGDISAHYGFEARFLFAQQLLHELLAADQRQHNLKK